MWANANGAQMHARRLRTVSGRTVVVGCNEADVAAADWLLSQIESIANRGFRASDGAVFDFGWIPLTLRARGTDLVVHAPNGGDGETDDLSCALEVQSEQVAGARSLNVPPIFAKHRQSVHVAKNAWGAMAVMLSRIRECTADDSGWIALAKGEEVSEFEIIPVHELVRRKRPWIQALALPAGYIVEFHGDSMVAVGLPH